MKKVLVISLNGRAYSFEEDAFQLLQTYLDDAEKSLSGNPDREEIILDLEQAVGEKCNSFLNQRKNVVTAVEISQVLQEMGPVAKEDGSETESKDKNQKQSSSPNSGDVPKRLYLLHDGAMLAGLCNGIAAFLKVDVTIVRIVFVIFALLSFGTGILIYLSLCFIVPFAQTLEEHSAAQGIPFTAQELIEEAKRNISAFSREHIQSRHWRRGFRRKGRNKKNPDVSSAWKAEWKKDWKADWKNDAKPLHESFSYEKRIFFGFLVTLLTLVHAVFSTMWILVLLSVATTGEVFGHSIATGVPLWAEVLIVFLVGNVVSEPLRCARQKIKLATGGVGFNWYYSIDNLVWLGVVGGIFWYAYLVYPEVHASVEKLPEVWNMIAASWKASVK